MLQSNLTHEATERFRADPTWLSAACGLPAETLAPLLPFYLPLAEQIVSQQRSMATPLIVGMQGPQGAGKTTLTQLLQCVLSDLVGLRVATLSIDDLYLTRAERAELARRVHPLFQTRGVPGTHDVALGLRVLDALCRPGVTAIPRFDKAQDERAPQDAWPVISGACDVVLFEGLWIGLSALDPCTLAAPINTLEATEDPDAVWRINANCALTDDYPALFARCGLLVHLQVPDFACVQRWRTAAEHSLRARLVESGADTARTMDDAALARFFQHYERFTLHAMRVMPSRADLVLRLDSAHRLIHP